MVAAPAISERLLTPEEFEALEDAGAYELYDGVLVERQVSVESSKLGIRIERLIGNFAEVGNLGDVLGSDIGLQMFRRQNRIPRPDVAFVAAARMTDEVQRSGFLRIPPDLIVEVISPSDNAVMNRGKVREYLDAGVRLVWVVYPQARTIDVYRLDGTVSAVSLGGALDGEDVLPGFSLPLSELFAGLPEPIPLEGDE